MSIESVVEILFFSENWPDSFMLCSLSWVRITSFYQVEGNSFYYMRLWF